MNPYIIGAALGLSLLKQHEDKKNADQQRSYQSKRERFSPWTGEKGQYVQDPSLMGNVMQGLSMGLPMADMYGLDSDLGEVGTEAADAGPDLYESPQRVGVGGQMEPMSPETNAYYGADYGPSRDLMNKPAPTGPIGDEGFFNPYSSSSEAIPVNVPVSGSRRSYSPGAYGGGRGPISGRK